MMEKNAKIYVAGHRGMVGSAIVRELNRQGYTNIVTRTHKELDLTRQDQVEAFFAAEKPEYVFLAAAKVGGIVANQNALADFMYSRRLEKRLQEAGVFGFLLYLSPDGSPAYEGKLSSDLRAGKNQRGLCVGEDFRPEIL